MYVLSLGRMECPEWLKEELGMRVAQVSLGVEKEGGSAAWQELVYVSEALLQVLFCRL